MPRGASPRAASSFRPLPLLELLGDLTEFHAQLAEGGMIHQRAPAGLKIHPLTHPHVAQGIPRNGIQHERPVEDVPKRLPARDAHDVIRRGLIVMLIDPPKLPRAVTVLSIDFQILLDEQHVAPLFAPGPSEHPADRLTAAIFHHAPGLRGSGEKFHGIESR